MKILQTIQVAFEGRKLCFGKITVRTPFLLCAMWFVLMLQDASGFFLIGTAASVWHELGHVFCYIALFHEFPDLTVSLSGISLSLQVVSSKKWQEVLLALAGPLNNVLAAAVMTIVLRHRMTVAGASFWAANLLVGGFNLLPVPPLDGYRLVHCLWKFWANKLLFRGK